VEVVVESNSRPTCGKFRNVVIEAALVALAGTVFAFAANAISKRGLDLTRDYFPGSQISTPQITTSGKTNVNVAESTNAPTDTATEETVRRLAADGLNACDDQEALRLFQDPGNAEGRIVFVDARNEEHYAAGHIPGAYQFDRFRATDFIPTVLPACLKAEKVVVYCDGGACEESEFAAITLRDIGVSREKLFVYTGGIHDWENNGSSMEVGARNSGKISSGKK